MKTLVLEKYPRGRRGSPAKGVVRVNRSQGSNPCFSANQNLNRTHKVWFRFFVCKNSVRIGVFRLLASKSCSIRVFVRKVISFCSTIEIRAFSKQKPDVRLLGTFNRVLTWILSCFGSLLQSSHIFLSYAILSAPDCRAVDVQYLAYLQHCKTCHQDRKRFVFHGG